MTWSNGNTYTGQWLDDERHGNGIMKWADGENYEGEFSEGQRYGCSNALYAVALRC